MKFMDTKKNSLELYNLWSMEAKVCLISQQRQVSKFLLAATSLVMHPVVLIAYVQRVESCGTRILGSHTKHVGT